MPSGTVTLLLGDVEGSTRAWESDPAASEKAVIGFNGVVAELVGRFDGVRLVEQGGEGDWFVAAFSRARDGVACALAVQRAVGTSATPQPIWWMEVTDAAGGRGGGWSRTFDCLEPGARQPVDALDRPGARPSERPHWIYTPRESRHFMLCHPICCPVGPEGGKLRRGCLTQPAPGSYRVGFEAARPEPQLSRFR